MLHKLAICQGTVFKLLTSQNICPPTRDVFATSLRPALHASQVKLGESTAVTQLYNTLCILNFTTHY